MTKEMERIGKILVEKGEGGCWHSWTRPDYLEPSERCVKCYRWRDTPDVENPDFSDFANFGRLLKIARDNDVKVFIYDTYIDFILGDYKDIKRINFSDIDQIPALVATELARVIEEKKC